MTTYPRLQVTTFYSSRAQTARGGSSRVLGIMSLLVGVVWLYVVWGPVDRFLFTRYNRSVPVLAYFDLQSLFQTPPRAVANPAPPDGTEVAAHVTEAKMPLSDAERADRVLAANRYTTYLTALMYGWEYLATAAGLILTLAGAAGLVGVAQARRHQREFVFAMLGAILMSGAYGWWVWRTYRFGWDDYHVSIFVILLAFVSMTIGAAFSRGGTGLHRLAAAVVGISVVGSLVGLWKGEELRAFESGYVTPMLYGQVFVIQSLYAWVILAALRASRR